jgi:hypothetical protein
MQVVERRAAIAPHNNYAFCAELLYEYYDFYTKRVVFSKDVATMSDAKRAHSHARLRTTFLLFRPQCVLS